ncbi:ClpP/crotonase [Schizopora paradoxa]|uniref:ClpP/crotonase n=1 Tax=Schizopora paradoxa TaxID=27342 RepID=A0A0H2RW33_9AGAM|nr:ClpP/crotonase [Schizopora paradoxa]
MSKFSTEYIKVSERGTGVLLVELSRGPVNAFKEKFWRQFGQVFDSIHEDGTVRAVVLASAVPKMFSAGLDLNEALGSHMEKDPGRQGFYLKEHIRAFQSAISAVERCRVPVIAAVHGLAIGLAVDITSACDIRFAASTAVFAIKEVDVGLAADIGTLARFPKVVGNQSLVRELAMTARNFGADEALAVGFISKVVKGNRGEVVAAALDTARLIASKSPVAVVGTKQILLHSRDHSVQDNLEYTAAWNAFALQSSDTVDCMAAFKTKKDPSFSALPNISKSKL